MAIYCIRYGVLKKHFCRLSDIALALCWTDEARGTKDRVIGDLGPEDEVFLFSNKRSLTFRRSGVRAKVSLMIAEPRVIQRGLYRLVPWMWRRFHRIASHDDSILSACPNGEKWIHGGRWVNAHTAIGAKNGMVSIIASSKRSSGGHLLRHQLIAWAKIADVALDLYGKGYQPLDNKADGHIPFRFSVVIENNRSAGYFTEKLIDALLCESVPIYWGDPEITLYFDMRGMVICNDISDLQSAVSGASGPKFEEMQPFVAENKRRALALFDAPNAMTRLAGPRIFDFG